MTFSHPFALLGLLLAPALWALASWRLRVMAARMARLSRKAAGTPPRARLQVGLLAGAVAALAVALAGPRWGRGSEEAVVSGRNLMLAVDVSNSMLAQDVRPDRLGRAKADLIDLVDALRGDRAGLLAFRGRGALLCPLTTDAAFLRQGIDGLSPESAPPGETDLADALAKCLEAFDLAETDHNAIVLISDGEDLAGRAQALAREAGRRGIPIFAVGVGSPQGATVPGVTHEGKPVTSRLDGRTLRALAEASGGAYVPLAGAGGAETTLGAVYARHLARLAAAEERERLETALADRTPLFAALAAALAVAAGCLSLGRVAAALALAALPLAAGAQEDAARVFNDALARYQAGDVTNALGRVRQVLDPGLEARAATLEGALLLRLSEAAEAPAERLELRGQAAGAFARALRAEPSEAAQRNLSRALEGMAGLRREARKAAALRRYEGKGLGLAPELLAAQRALMRRPAEVAALPPAARIAAAEALAAETRAQADRWFPVLEALPQAVTNETLRAEIAARAEAEQAALDAAAEGFEALALEAGPLAAGEPFVYDLWKGVADPPMLNAEAIAVHSNALNRLPPYQPAREDLPEVLALTRQFRLVFPEWAEEQLRQAAASTNETAFTEADRDLIERTAAATEPLLAPPVSEDALRRVMANLLLIRDHLPKQGGQGQGQPPPQQQPPQGQPPPSGGQDQSRQSPPQSPAEREAQARREDLEALLQKAADRTRAHEEEKRRARRAILPPNVRDW